ncbi:MAG: C39 family peptidase [Austwickia sp.]|nr:C39 family peptidase [Austwickia sp.]
MTATPMPRSPQDLAEPEPTAGRTDRSRTPTRRAVLGALGGMAVAAATVATPTTAQAAVTRRIAESFWRPATMGAGTGAGTALGAAGVRIAQPTGRFDYRDPHRSAGTVTYETATWDSPVVTPGFAWTELIASWNAETPPGTWVQILVRGIDALGTATAWLVLGRWAAADVSGGAAITRASLDGQRTAGAAVSTDTLVTGAAAAYRSWQLRVVLLRAAGTTATPVLRLAGAVATAVPASGSTAEATSRFGGTVTTLAVPTYSQEVHSGHYTAWGGGGEAWCSATTTAMILDYWGAGPTPAEKAWVSPATDAQVDVAARMVYDAEYGGTGNWPFNTAYAGTRATAGVPLEGFVTRLADLAAAESYLSAGVPLGVSLSFSADQLTGAGYGTGGHLMVLVGFDGAGNPVVNDPASHLIADNGRVRMTYQRGQFERAWAESGRTVYVIRPSTTAAPPPAPSGARVPISPGSRSVPRRRG